MSARSDRQAAREVVGAYHEGQLAALVDRVGAAIDNFREGQLDAFGVDRALFQYSRAAKELWKFCNLGPPEITAKIIRDQPAVDWWERGAPRRR
mgnify:CR=1 FL=1